MMTDFDGEVVESTEIVAGESFFDQIYEAHSDVDPEMMTMTPMQWKYVFNYLESFDPRKAALQAGYAETTANSSLISSNRKIRFWISRLVKERALPEDAVLARLADIATGDIGDFITVLPETGQVFFDLRKAEEARKLHLIKRLKYVKHGPGAGGVEIELHDPLRALELIGKSLGMFQDTNVKVDNYTITVVREGEDPGVDS